MFVKQLIEALHPFGDVLEVGFGQATKEIQKYHPRTHTIITKDVEAQDWAKNHHAIVIDDVWQGALAALGVFDTIFFGQVDPIVPIQMEYTDSILDGFCSAVKDKKAASKFLAELEQSGQITKKQKEKMIQKYGFTHEKPPVNKLAGQMLPFLKLCIEDHMREGSRFSCFLKQELDDPKFFDEIVVNPILDVREEGRILIIQKLV